MQDTTRSASRPYTIALIREHLALIVTLLAFVALAGLYVTTTPALEMPEEPWHLRRIADMGNKDLPPGHIAWAQSLPVLSVQKQPPLYYWLGAALVQPFDWASDPSVYELNPHARLADLAGVTNRNVMLARRGILPREPLGSSLLLLRYFSVLVTAAGLFFAYRILLKLTRTRSLAWAALLATGFLPGYLYLNSGIGPIALGLCLNLITIYLVVDMVDTPGYPYALIRGAALCAGLTAMTVWWGWAAVLLVTTGYALRAREWRVLRETEHGHHGVRLSLILMVAMAMIWPMQLLFTGPVSESSALWARVGDMSLLLRTDLTLRAFWGLFGWLNIPIEPPYYTVIGILLILGSSGLILRLIQWYWSVPSRTTLVGEVRGRTRPWQRVVLAWAVLGLAVFTIHVLSPRSAFIGVALLPLAPLVMLFLVLGMDAWVRTYGAFLIGAVVIVIIASAVAAPGAFIEPAYTRPEPLALPQLPSDVRPLDVAYGDSLYLVGYSLGAESVSPGGSLPVRLYWLARKSMDADYTAHVTVSGYHGTIVSSLFTRVGSGVFPTSMWSPGDVIAQDMFLPVDSDAQTPSAGLIGLAVSSESTGELQTPVGPAGQPLEPVLPVTRVRIGAESTVKYRPERPVDASLDGQITLVGYSARPTPLSPGDTLDVTLYWRAEGPLLYDYTVFVHLVDSAGTLVDQIDSQPLNGNYPTGLWAMGDEIRDQYIVTVPPDTAPGKYWLDVGMYRLDTGERLPIAGPEPLLDRIQLGPLSVQASRQ